MPKLTSIDVQHEHVMKAWDIIDKLLDGVKDPFTPEQLRVARFYNAFLAALSGNVSAQDWERALAIATDIALKSKTP